MQMKAKPGRAQTYPIARRIISLAFLLAVFSVPARAQVLSYEIESLDKLYENMDALGTGTKLPVDRASLTGMLGPWLDHLDSTRSIRMQIYLDHKKQGQAESTTDDLGKLEDLMSFITVVPVKDHGDALLGATTNLYTETKHDGFRHHLSGAKAPGAPGQQISISVGEKRGLVFISNSSNLLDRVISSYPTAGYPAGIAVPGTIKLNLNVEEFISTANNFVSDLSEGEERNDAAAVLSALTAMLDDISGFSIGCTAKSETMDIYSRIDVKKGSELSRKLADPKRTRNIYSSQIPPGSNFAMFSSNLDLMNDWLVSYFDTMIEFLNLSGDSEAPEALKSLEESRQILSKMTGLYSGETASVFVSGKGNTAAGFVTYYHLTDPELAMSLMEESLTGPGNAAAFTDVGIETVTATRDYKGNKILSLNYISKLSSAGDSSGANTAIQTAMLGSFLGMMAGEFAIVGNTGIYAVGAPAVTERAIDRLANPHNIPFSARPEFKNLFPNVPKNLTGAFTFSPVGILRSMLEKLPAAQPEMLAGIPTDTAGIGGITVSRSTNISSVMRISYNELQAIQSAVPALQGLFMQFMMSAAMSGAAGVPLDHIGAEGVQDSAANASAACMLNLHLISVAKEMHAGQSEGNANSAPTMEELKPFLKTGNPECPLGGVYSINAPGINPACSLPGHSLSID